MTSLRVGKITLAFALLAARSFALPVHTWVSGTGSDSNSGTRTSPFATFQAAVNATAPGGVVSVVDPGDFGPVTISHAITIDGGGIGGTITVDASINQAIAVQAGTSDTVILRHLTVNAASGVVIGIFSAGNVIIEDCYLENIGAPSPTVTRVVIQLSCPGTNIVVKDTTIASGDYGIYADQSLTASLRGVTITGAVSGAQISSALVEISNSVITHNYYGLEGFTGGTINVANSVLSYNQLDVFDIGGVVLVSSNNTLFANGTGPIIGMSSRRRSVPNDSDRGKSPPGQDKR